MKNFDEMLHNLSLESNENTERANKAFYQALRNNEKFWYTITGYNYGFDIDTGDVLYFFQCKDFDRLTEELRKELISVLRQNWEEAQFEVLEKKELDKDVYYYVGFKSIFFRLKSLV